MPLGPLGPFGLISLIYLLFGAKVVYQLIRNFRQTFDRNFTPEDRVLVDQAAFFVLVPISVALHELGHAIAIKLYGGHILDWGYYGFAGYVGFDPYEFTAAQRIIIAAAGTIVNLILAAIAVGLVFLKRPPMRAAVNELLIQFTWISLLNALVVYPLLDFVSDLNGDWRQMYDGGVPALSAVILVIHIAVLALLFWAWRSPKAQARITQLTGQPAGPAPRNQTSRRRIASPGASNVEATVRESANRVASGWPVPVEGAVRRTSNGASLLLTWQDGAAQRSVLATLPDAGGLELTGVVRADGVAPVTRPLGHASGPVDVERLTLMLRIAMETVAGWPPASSSASRPPSPTSWSPN
ncbi:MAG: hypothetical protein U0031_02100 [Thermomicrobiales bacterium]